MVDPLELDSTKRRGAPSALQGKRSKKGKKSEDGLSEADVPTTKVIPAPQDLLDKEMYSETALLSMSNKAPMVQLSEDKLSATSSRGYRMARATHGVYHGTWCFEVNVKHLGSTGHCRLGWATKQAELQAPVGYDAHGYAYRDIEGLKVSSGVCEPYGKAFQEGDTIGCIIHLPEGGRQIEPDCLQQAVHKHKGIPVVEVQEEVKPEPLPGSFIAFMKNGELQEKAFSDILEGTYYPAGSIYTLPEQTEGATLSFNFGPDMAFPTPEMEGIPTPIPMCEFATKMAAQFRDRIADGLPPGATTSKEPAEAGEAAS